MSCFEDYMDLREEIEKIRRKQHPDKSLGVREEQTWSKNGCPKGPCI